MFIISLGPFCITKFAINDMNLDSPTMPFDWMFSSLKVIQEWIQDDFNLLLDKNAIKSTNPCWSPDKSFNECYNQKILAHPTIQYHLLSKNEMCDYYNFHMWNHYNLSLEDKYDYYVKLVNRFRTALLSIEQKMFFFTLYYDSNFQEVQEFDEFLCKYTSNYKIIVLRCQLKPASATVVPIENVGNIIVCDLHLEKWDDKIPKELLPRVLQLIPEFHK